MTTVKGVVSQQGRPLQDATVMVVEGTQSFTDLAYLTDEKGGFQLQLMPGEYRLRVVWEEKSVEKAFRVVSDQKTETLQIEMP